MVTAMENQGPTHTIRLVLSRESLCLKSIVDKWRGGWVRSQPTDKPVLGTQATQAYAPHDKSFGICKTSTKSQGKRAASKGPLYVTTTMTWYRWLYTMLAASSTIVVVYFAISPGVERGPWQTISEPGAIRNMTRPCRHGMRGTLGSWRRASNATRWFIH